ncbi:hypothetical protein [Streptomyces milbemycinicus]
MPVVGPDSQEDDHHDRRGGDDFLDQLITAIGDGTSGADECERSVT